MGALAELVVAHGGTAGLIVELTLVLGLLVLGAAVWVGARKEKDGDGDG